MSSYMPSWMPQPWMQQPATGPAPGPELPWQMQNQMNQTQAPMVRFFDPNQQMFTGQPVGPGGGWGGGGWGGGGGAPGGFPGAGGAPPGGGPPGGMPPWAQQYLQAIQSMGATPTPGQNAAAQFGPMGFAAAQDVLGQQRQQRQEADRAQAIGLAGDARREYNWDPRRAAEMRQVMDLLSNPEIISPALRETILSRSADATAGGQRAAMDQLRTATGGRGGAFVSGAADIARTGADQNLAAQRDTDIQAATLNRQGQLDAINTGRASLGAETANQGQFWQWLSDLYSGTRYGMPDLAAGAGVAGLGQIMGQAPWAQGGFGGYGPQGFAGPNQNFWGSQQSLPGGNPWGNVTPNFWGVGATAQAPSGGGWSANVNRPTAGQETTAAGTPAATPAAVVPPPRGYTYTSPLQQQQQQPQPQAQAQPRRPSQAYASGPMGEAGDVAAHQAREARRQELRDRYLRP